MASHSDEDSPLPEDPSRPFPDIDIHIQRRQERRPNISSFPAVPTDGIPAPDFSWPRRSDFTHARPPQVTRPGAQHRVSAERDITDNVRKGSKRRRRSRKHAETKLEPEGDCEGSDDVLDNYYGGGSHDSPVEDSLTFSTDEEEVEDVSFRPSRPNISYALPPRPDHYHSRPNVSYALPPRPARYHSRPTINLEEEPFYRPLRPVTRRSNYLTRAPRRAGGLWLRAAKLEGNDIDGPGSAKLRLVVTRHGERYKGRDIPYVVGSWNDVVFARRLKEEYRILKATKIGFQETIASYTKIHFVYFRQYHAFSSRDGDKSKWKVSALVPITRMDDEKAKVWFMYKLQKLSSTRYRLATEKKSRSRPKIWTNRLEELIEPGAVIDMEVLETFDVKRICMGLLIAIFVSLAVALAYGFGMDQDFSTGFSIASWLITAAGFFAAIVALFGDDSSTSLRASFSAELRDVGETYRDYA